MDTTNYNEQVTKTALDTIERAKNQIPIPGSEPRHANVSNELMQEKSNAPVQTEQKVSVQENAKNDITLGDPPSTVAKSFDSLPIENLICAPIIAAAKGQQELTSVYIDTLMRLAYKEDSDQETNILKFNMQRPVDDGQGHITMTDVEIQAPLLSLVPVPAFTMDEISVDFSMEVKACEAEENKSHAESTAQAGYKPGFGFSANITGSVSSDSMHKRQTDSSATYNIRARAVQQQPSEGMAKLTSLFAQMMEPIKSDTSQQ